MPGLLLCCALCLIKGLNDARSATGEWQGTKAQPQIGPVALRVVLRLRTTHAHTYAIAPQLSSTRLMRCRGGSMQRGAVQFRLRLGTFCQLVPPSRPRSIHLQSAASIPPSRPPSCPLPRCTCIQTTGQVSADAAHAKGTKAVRHKMGQAEKLGTTFYLACNYVSHLFALHWSICLLVFLCCRRLFSCVWPSVLSSRAQFAGGKGEGGRQSGKEGQRGAWLGQRKGWRGWLHSPAAD
jgi:hypothetical protein